MSVSINGTNGLTFNDASVQNTAATGFGFKNRILNPAMMIDQRNAGASVTVGPSTGSLVYTVDRWAGFATSTRTFTAQQSASAPAGFINSVKLTVGVSGAPSATEQIFYTQNIEGFNVADFGWGTSSAQPITVSFWVNSSVTGIYGVGITNSNGSRTYPTTYTINSPNTWEQKTITISGDQSGTWLTTNGIGLVLRFDLGSGSNFNGTANTWSGGYYWRTSSCVNWIANAGATFYITGVQLEKGSTATSFDYRPYGTELALCQRYYQSGLQGSGYATGTTSAALSLAFMQTMRTTPTIAFTNVLTVTDGAANYTQSSASTGTYLGSANGGLLSGMLNFSGMTIYRPIVINVSGFANPIMASAEL